ncbi:MAG: hypothetical protein BBJ57_02795 [Desulfobacterales bacterium PC51MH44]|nr:MAG: hypothetical protein BBJ57_02795 [Desulfobacterales bacterium PC51MH44]
MAAPVVPIHEASTVDHVILNWNAHHRDLSLRQHALSPASPQPVLSDTTAETQNTKQLSTQTITINFTSFIYQLPPGSVNPNIFRRIIRNY